MKLCLQMDLWHFLNSRLSFTDVCPSLSMLDWITSVKIWEKELSKKWERFLEPSKIVLGKILENWRRAASSRFCLTSVINRPKLLLSKGLLRGGLFFFPLSVSIISIPSRGNWQVHKEVLIPAEICLPSLVTILISQCVLKWPCSQAAGTLR